MEQTSPATDVEPQASAPASPAVLTPAAESTPAAEPTPAPVRRRGRPRSEASRAAVLQAAAGLMEPGGQAKLTMEGIAARAGVSKQTVYRWWKTKVDVLVEAVGAGYLNIPLPLPADTGDLPADLTHWLRAMSEEIAGGGATELAQSLVGAMASTDGRGRQIHGVLVAPLRAGLHERFRAAQLPAGVDREMLAETVAAQLVMHVLFAEPVDEAWIARLVSHVTSVAPAR